MSFDLIIIGGGAAGFFGAIQAADKNPDLKILILEKSNKLLAKVKVSGGGRCNVTHYEFQPGALSKHYPRGEKILKNLFKSFQAKDVVSWFEQKGVTLCAEDDGRMFPNTNSSQTIIDCFLSEAQRHQIRILQNEEVVKLEHHDSLLNVTTSRESTYTASHVLVTMGGHAQRRAYQWLEDVGHTITPLVPSLFTFNDSSKKFVNLMGVSVENAIVKIAGTKFQQQGPVLITHWGLSGPAVIKLSAWAATYLSAVQYDFTALVSWVGDQSEEQLRKEFQQLKTSRPKLKIFNQPLYQLPTRLWQALCQEAEIEESKIWGELSNRNLNKLIEQLIRCSFPIKGKTTFKEEFVTCGGVDVAEINIETMESKKIPGLYFAGEVLNIDGETGGFNFQAAWTTAWCASQHIALKTKAGA